MYQETEKSFSFRHCWVLLNGKAKWTQLVEDLKVDKSKNDGSNSH